MPRTEAQKAARRARKQPSGGDTFGPDDVAKDSGAPPSVDEVPPPPSAADFGDDEPASKKKDLSSTALAQLSEQLTDTEASGYVVASALTSDPRWELIQEEKKQLRAAWRVTLELYGNDPLVLKWLPLVGIIGAHVTPFLGRIMMGPPTKEAIEQWEKMKRERESAGKKVAA